MNGYKATRLDGTSFYDGATRWEMGSTVKAPIPHGNLLCRAGILHFSDAPAETLVGGSWPCRLFSVSGRPVAQDGHKFGAWSLAVLTELPAWQVFGPQGEEVAALLQDISLVTPRSIDWDAARVADWVADWDATRVAAWVADWDATRVAARVAARDATRDAARGAAWVAARGAARVATAALVARDLISPEQFAALRDAAWHAPWDAVSAATGDATAALVARDLISPEQFAALWEPWAKVSHEL